MERTRSRTQRSAPCHRRGSSCRRGSTVGGAPRTPRPDRCLLTIRGKPIYHGFEGVPRRYGYPVVLARVHGWDVEVYVWYGRSSPTTAQRTDQTRKCDGSSSRRADFAGRCVASPPKGDIHATSYRSAHLLRRKVAVLAPACDLAGLENGDLPRMRQSRSGRLRVDAGIVPVPRLHEPHNG